MGLESAVVRAQAPAWADGAAPVAASRFDGRDFAGVTLPAEAQRYEVSFGAARVWAWDERGTARLVLERDVKVTIGPYGFIADRAVAWSEPVEINGENGEQLAVYVENLRDPGGPAGIAQQADRLLVTSITVGTTVKLRADVLTRARPAPGGDEFLREGEGRLARYLEEVTAAGAGGMGGRSGAPVPGRAGEGGTGSPERLPMPSALPPDDRGTLPPAERLPIVEPASGLVSFSSEETEIIRGDASSGGEHRVIARGGLVVQYQVSSPARTMQLTAERAVVFLAATARPEEFRYAAEDVIGIYLEGDVIATDGRYTLRGSRVYYDIARDRAIVLDAVFWTYDEEKGMPLYLRAGAIRQESRNQWSAERVRLANVGFAEPHFSIGATSITLTRDETVGRRVRNVIDAKDVTFRAGELPLAWLPRVQGEFRPSILKKLTVESEAGDAIVRTGWDLYTIFGLDAKEGNEATLLLDGYFARGVGVGSEVAWDTGEIVGSAFGYFIHDGGVDRLTSGAEIDRDDDNRGMFLAEQRWRIADQWTVFLEGSYISDETFVDAFYEELAETRREFASSAYIRRLEENNSFTIEARGTFNDFISNEYLLQSRGYQVEKLPEVAYHRVADDLFGVISYTSDYSYSRSNLRFSRPRLRELGFDTARRAGAGFGLTPDDSLEAVLLAQGFTDEAVNRFDTRQEIEVPLAAGALNIVPFAVGRFTYWDNEFDAFGTTDDENYRLWGGGGARVFTTIQRVDDEVESRFFDLHRIRHLIEPNATFWSAATTIDQKELPVYDEEVESLAAGSVMRGGVRNTWQTMRGGPPGSPEQRSVDWLVVNTDFIWSTSEVDVESPFGRFIEARPEESFFGRFFSNEVLWNLTETIALTNDVLVDTEEGEFARTTVGAIFDHGYGFSSIVEWRDLPALESTYLDFGARYEFTRKYAASAFATYDLDVDEFQAIGFSVTRRFPQWTVSVSLSYDNITDDTSVGVTLRPAGLGADDRRRQFTREPVAGELIRGENAATGPRAGRLQTGPFGVE